MASPKGAYTPQSGPLARQTFPSYYQYLNARAQQQGFSGYTEERNWRLEQAARANLDRVYGSYPKARADHVMRVTSLAQKRRIRDASMQDFYENNLGVDTEVFYHD